MSDSADEAEGQRFSLVVGGPYTALLARCRLLGPDRLPTAGAALLFAGVAWLAPGVAAVLQGARDPGYDGLAYFSDLSTVARLFVAIGVIVVTERHADQRLSQLLREFWAERIVVGEARERFFDLLRAADRRTSSAAAQLLLLVVAWLGAGRAMDLVLHIEHVGWEGTMAGGNAVLSWAGMVARHLSVPLFEFLILLWLWRLGVWSVLLLRVARLPLRLTPLHGDRCAGLGFLGMFPGVFRGFVFALSCVVAAMVYKDIQVQQGTFDVELLRNLAFIWVGLVLLLFVGPLFAFYPVLYALREQELTRNGRIVGRWYTEFHRRWLAGAAPDDEQPPEPGPSLGELDTAFDTLRAMRAVPVDIAVLKQLLLAALLPLGAVGATQVPLRELLGGIAGFVL